MFVLRFYIANHFLGEGRRAASPGDLFLSFPYLNQTGNRADSSPSTSEILEDAYSGFEGSLSLLQSLQVFKLATGSLCSSDRVRRKAETFDL